MTKVDCDCQGFNSYVLKLESDDLLHVYPLSVIV